VRLSVPTHHLDLKRSYVIPIKDYEFKNPYIRDVWVRLATCHLRVRSHASYITWFKTTVRMK